MLNICVFLFLFFLSTQTLGMKLDYDSPSFKTIQKMNALFNDIFGSGTARRLDFIPLLKYFRNDCYCRMQEALQLRDEFWEEQLEKLKVCVRFLHLVYKLAY